MTPAPDTPATAESDETFVERNHHDLNLRRRCFATLATIEMADFDRLIALARRAVAPSPDTPPLTITYRNHRGEVAQRRIIPIAPRYGTTEWHPEPQWLLRAYDVDKGAEREFAMGEMSSAASAATSGFKQGMERASGIADNNAFSDEGRRIARLIGAELASLPPDAAPAAVVEPGEVTEGQGDDLGGAWLDCSCNSCESKRIAARTQSRPAPTITPDPFTRPDNVAEAVVAEREACARDCDSQADYFEFIEDQRADDDPFHAGMAAGFRRAAKRIRTRSTLRQEPGR